jgi:hypothetical protein
MQYTRYTEKNGKKIHYGSLARRHFLRIHQKFHFEVGQLDINQNFAPQHTVKLFATVSAPQYKCWFEEEKEWEYSRS